MKRLSFPVVLTILSTALIGCDYTAPLTTTPHGDMNTRLIGLWSRQRPDKQEEKLLVLPLNPKELLIVYPLDADDGMVAKACMARAADRDFAQIQWIGTVKGTTPDDNRVYQFAVYEFAEEGRLSIRLLNPDVVDRDVSSSKELTAAIEKNAADPNLFRAAMVFDRVPDKQD